MHVLSTPSLVLDCSNDWSIGARYRARAEAEMQKYSAAHFVYPFSWGLGNAKSRPGDSESHY